MRAFDRIALWLRALFMRRRVETEMAKEMRLHLEMEVENNVRMGMTPTDAKRAALVSFGGIEDAKEAVRDERGTRWLEHGLYDVRFAARTFRKRAGFAAAVVTLIALGVGANAAIFSVIHNLLIAPLPFADGNRMVEFSATAGGGEIQITPSQNDVDRWRGAARAVERITVLQRAGYELGDSTRGPTETVTGVMLTPGAADFVGMHPLLGRDIVASDTLAESPRVALLGQRLWERRFGGAADVVGTQVTLNGQVHSVIGVVPRGFAMPFMDGDQIFTALRSTGANRPVTAIAKLRRGSTVDDANREMKSIFTSAPTDRGLTMDLPQVHRAVDDVRPLVRRTLYLMFGAVIIVLLIACANVANLLLSHAWSRQREFAIRAAMGAGRARLIRQVFTESLLLSSAGGALGLGIAALTVRTISALQPENLDLSKVRLEPAVILGALGLSVVTGVLFGTAPALFVSASRAADSLKAGARAATGSTTARRVRAGLVVFEVALSVVLLLGAGLLVRTIVAMQHADLGIQSSGLAGMQLRLSDRQFADGQLRQAAMQAALERIRAIPGIREATLATTLPPDFAIGLGGFEIEGRASSPNDSLKTIGFNLAMPDYFTVTGLRLLEGRTFAAAPTPTDKVTSTEAVVNRSFARRFWPDGKAIGARVRRGTIWLTIVGISGDVSTPGRSDRLTATQVYQAIPAAPRRATLIWRSDLPLASVVPAITRAVGEASPLIKVGDAQLADALVADARAIHRFTLKLIGAFAMLALVIAAFGLHGVIAYNVGQRTREIGVRVALGAQRPDIMRLVMGHGFALAGAGIVLGVASGMAASRVIRGMLYGVAPADPMTIVAVGVVLTAVATVACYAPARRAVGVDPVEALRSE